VLAGTMIKAIAGKPGKTIEADGHNGNDSDHDGSSEPRGRRGERMRVSRDQLRMHPPRVDVRQAQAAD
jgi:hypothetical protein